MAMGRRSSYDEISIEVSVRRDELLDRLKKNREKHDVEYHAAMKLWQQCLSETLQSIDSSACFQFPTALSRLNSECPVSHVEEYDRAIDIFSMGINDEIKLDSSAFNQFCRDEWDWKQSTATNRFYRLAVQAQA